MPLAQALIFSLGMIVAFVPEGLLPTVTLALAMGVQRMAARHALVKRLSAVETLGCTTVICTDKTGTLTQNEMTVRALWLGGRTLRVTGEGYAPGGTIMEGARVMRAQDDEELRALLLAAALCTDARVVPPEAPATHWTALGDPTEAALLVVAAKGGVDLERETARYPRLRTLPFESRRKRMSTVHELAGGRRVYVKGAPKEVLELCTHVWHAGRPHALSAPLRARIEAATDRFAAEGLRVLAVAQRDLPGDLELSVEGVERELTFLGLVAMMDPPRPEVAAAVATCHRAGIRVIMITGDYGLTAQSIARRIGILRGPGGRIVTGSEVDTMSEEALAAALEGDVIFARMAPEHKLRVVEALKRRGHVVAVTGDGVNDAPALKRADIGVAMGESGSDVAKEAADLILLDDNFATIVNAVEEGRAVYANIKRFTSYIFTSNVPEAVPFVLFALSGGRIPLALNIMQILAVDLGTDMVPALALGAERPEPGVMDRPPRRREEHLISPALLARAYLWLGPLQSVAVMAAFYSFYWRSGYAGSWFGVPDSGPLYRLATTVALATVVMTQVGNLFAHRTERLSILQRGFFSNRLAWAGVASELVLLAFIVYLPPLQRVFGTAALSPRDWLGVIVWAPVLLIADELRKLLARRKKGAV